MCSVFYVDDGALKGIENIVSEVDRKIRDMHFERDVHPTDLTPVIVRDNRGLKLTWQRWGYPGIQKSGVIFNARAESVQEKKIFSNGIRYHRAVIPVTHFYEWSANKERNTFKRHDGNPMYLAGFFDMINNEERFVMLTTQANHSMQMVHDRMPLVLERNQLEDWICDDGSVKEILRQEPVLLKRQVEYEQMRMSFSDRQS